MDRGPVRHRGARHHRDGRPHAIGHVWWRRKAHRRPNCWSAIHGHSRWCALGGQAPVGLAGDRALGAGDVPVGNAGDVVDAGTPPVLVHGIETDEVLLRVAGHLRWRPRHHEVTRNAPPVAFSVFVQTKEKQSVWEIMKPSATIEFSVRVG